MCKRPRELPYIDEHVVRISAPPLVIGRALWHTVGDAFSGRSVEAVGRFLRCRDTRPSGAESPEVGATITGFSVAASREAALWI